jgi:hypothetical protein
MRIVQRESRKDAILRRVRRAVSDLTHDPSLSSADKLEVMYALLYELEQGCVWVDAHSDGSERPGSVFSGDLI